jgi:hypothetical protein
MLARCLPGWVLDAMACRVYALHEFSNPYPIPFDKTQVRSLDSQSADVLHEKTEQELAARPHSASVGSKQAPGSMTTIQEGTVCASVSAPPVSPRGLDADNPQSPLGALSPDSQRTQNAGHTPLSIHRPITTSRMSRFQIKSVGPSQPTDPLQSVSIGAAVERVKAKARDDLDVRTETSVEAISSRQLSNRDTSPPMVKIIESTPRSSLAALYNIPGSDS